MPKSKELLFLCRNVGTGQRSALLYSLCFSSHLSPSSISLFAFFCIILFSSFCFTPLAFSKHLLYFSLLHFLFLAVLFTDSLPLFPFFPHIFFLSILVILSIVSYISQFYISYPSLPLSLSPPPLSVPAVRRSPHGAAAAA